MITVALPLESVIDVRKASRAGSLKSQVTPLRYRRLNTPLEEL